MGSVVAMSASRAIRVPSLSPDIAMAAVTIAMTTAKKTAMLRSTRVRSSPFTTCCGAATSGRSRGAMLVN